MVDGSSEPMAIYDCGTRMWVAASPTLLKLMKCEKAEFLSIRGGRFLPHVGLVAPMENLPISRFLNDFGKSSGGRDFPLFTKQNDLLEVEVFSQRFNDDSGEFFVFHFRPTDSMLEGERRWNAAVLDGANNSIISTLPNGIITTFNKAAEKLLGYAGAEVVGKETPALFHDPKEIQQRSNELSKELQREIAPGFGAFVEKALIKGRDVHNWTYIRKDKSRVMVRLTVTAIYDSHQKHIGFLGIAEDLTDSLRLESQLAHSAKMASLGEMAGGIAHEINNPLAIISGKASYLRLLIKKENYTPAVFEEELIKVERTVDRIAKIIRGLRSFSRSSENDPMTSTNFQIILEDTLQLCLEKFRKNNIDVKIAGSLDQWLECRPSQISQLLMNLLSNSYDAVLPLDEKWIEIKVDRKDQELLISVIDSGKGIAAEIVDRIMQPFFTTKEVGKGTGLGLSISKGIAEDHHGTLVYDRTASNTKFIICLPVHQ